MSPRSKLATLAGAALLFAACLPPLPPEVGARIVSADDQPIPAPIAAAVDRSAKIARNVCLGRGYGEASVTFDNAGSVMRAKVERADDIADVECIENVFKKTHVPGYAGAPLTVVASFELDAMRVWKPAQPMFIAPGLGSYQ